MFALAEAALRHDGTDLYKYVSPKSGASLKKIVDGYLRMAFHLERNGTEGGKIRLATFGDGSTGCLINGRLDDTRACTRRVDTTFPFPSSKLPTAVMQRS